jgi:hypothetical protein
VGRPATTIKKALRTRCTDLARGKIEVINM